MDQHAINRFSPGKKITIALMASIFGLAMRMFIWTIVDERASVSPPLSPHVPSDAVVANTEATTVYAISDALKGIIRPIRQSTTSYDQIVPVVRNFLVDTTPPERLIATGSLDIDMRLERVPPSDR